MKKLFCTLICCCVPLAAVAEDGQQSEPSAGMLRYPDISKDKIVFSYAGDLWTVSRKGGTATPLASPAGSELMPRFSPDGESIAFVGNYEGDQDLYVIPASGGIAKRMTYHPSTELLCDWTSDGKLCFATNGYSGLGRQTQLFTISEDEPLAQKLPVPYGSNASISEDGTWLAYTPHSRDNRTWKRYRGGMASDVWLFNLKTNESKQITDWEGTDSLPMFFGNKVYYLSDAGEEHRLNIWVYDTESGDRSQITEFKDFDCKWPSIGPGENGKGEIVVQNGGSLWLIDLENNEQSTVSIEIPGDRPKLRPAKIDASKFVTSGDISPKAKRVVVAARGDIWTLPAKNGAARNLTKSNGVAERSPSWSPDGRWIAYFSDATGEYELYIKQSDGRGETKQLTKDGDCFRYSPNWSPDSKHITFTDKTGAAYLHTIGGETKLIDTDPYAGRLGINWSHNSQWLTYAKSNDDRGGTSVVWVYNVADGSKNAVTSGFFSATSPVFDRKGEFLYFVTANSFNQPQYEDNGTTFIYAGTQKINAVSLRADVEFPMLPESDEETWEEEKEEEGDEDSDKEESEDESDDESDDEESDDENGDQESEAADSGDGLTGTWTIELLNDQIPADQRSAVMDLKLAEDGSVTGTVDTPGGARDITEGSFDKESGELRLMVEADGQSAEVNATVKDGEMTGTVSIGEMQVDFKGTLNTDSGDDDEGDEKDGKSKKDSKESAEPFEIEFDRIAKRAFELPIKQGNFGRLVVNDKNQLIYGRSAARGSGGSGSIQLFDMHADDPSEKTVLSGSGGFTITPDGKKMLVFKGSGSAYVVSAAAGQKLDKKVPTNGMTVMINPREEWKQVFTDAWRIQRDFFYDPTMHGVDWKAIHDHYADMLDDCNSRADVAFIIGEMIAELNVGHAYYRSGPSAGGGSNTPSSNVGLLGCTFEAAEGRYRVATIFEGGDWDTDARSPLRRVGIKEGDFILAVNDIELTDQDNPYFAFEGTAGDETTLTVSEDSKLDDDDRRVVIKPLSSDNNLRFRHWIETKRKMVADKTSGRVGYIYVINTGIPGQNDLFRQFYGQLGKDALIIDDRWNGGGQIPTRFIELMNRPVTNYWAKRDGRDWTWPPDSHQGPKCMLANGMAGSGGDMFPALFKQAGIGKVIGTRTWGGLVGISGNPQMIDGSSVTAPTFAYYEKDGTWGIEGHGVDPDIEVIDDPAKMVDGGDPQLEAAIDHMLSELKSNPYKKPERPGYADRSDFGIEEKDK